MFTRKHYQVIAEALQEAEREYPIAHDAINHIIYSLCAVFENDNPRFDRGKFIHATIQTTRPAYLLSR